jgi:predicted phosphodiesterase
MRIVTISDTHRFTDNLVVPDGDVLVHSGDATFHGREHEVRDFGKWLRSQPHKWKIFVAGNHDTSFENSPIQARQWLFDTESVDPTDLYMSQDGQTFYLQEQSVTVRVDDEELKIYGAPHQPFFCNWAFNVRTDEGLKAIWDKIPKDTDILVTHGPPYKLRDENNYGEHCGCKELRKAIQRVRPKLHVCGHIHEGYGVSTWEGTLIANSSICTLTYKPTNSPLIFEYKDGKIYQVS